MYDAARQSDRTVPLELPTAELLCVMPWLELAGCGRDLCLPGFLFVSSFAFAMRHLLFC